MRPHHRRRHYALAAAVCLAAAGARGALAASISGTVFEDVNYGGGAGRTLAASGGVARPNARVELFDGSGSFVTFATTDGSGNYSFGGISSANYTVRVVSDSVTSSRTGYVAGLLPVQTFRTNASTGAVVSVTDRVGGEVPSKVDAGNGSTTLAALTTATTAPQSITAVQLSGNLSGVSFGFNFDTIVNTNDAGQGSIRQLVLNGNALGGEGSLAQSGFRKNASGTNQALPAGLETSIFMVSDGAAHAGLRAGIANLLTSGVTSITLATDLPPITGAATSLDGSTQTVNVGNTNAALLGTGGTVGVDALTLDQVLGPEVELRDVAALTNGVEIQANNVVVRNLAIVGFGTTATEGAILVSAGTGALIENDVLGSTATSFVDPGSALRGETGIYVDGADNGTIRDNLIGFSVIRGIHLVNTATGWTVDGNEIRDNGLGTTDGDGIALNSSSTAACTGNLIVGSSSQGYIITASANNTFTNNTVTGNGVGIPAGVAQSTGITMRATATATLLDRNVVQGNHGAGIQVNDPSSGIRLRRNSFFGNGTISARNGAGPTGQIGIDLNAPGDDINFGTAPFTTQNDGADADTGGNGLLNYPVLTTAALVAGNLVLDGFARPGSVMELFVAAVDPTGFGEGQTWKVTLTEGGTGAGGDDPYPDTDAGTGTYGPGAINGLSQGTDTTNRFHFAFPAPSGVAGGIRLTATSTLGGNTSEFSGNVTISVAAADLALTKTDNPDPAPAGGELLYTLLVTNNGPNHATNVILTDTLPAGVTFVSATPSQGSCSGTGPVTCNLLGVLNGGTASVEILVITSVAGSITNNASVSANENDLVGGNNSATATTTVVNGGTTDIPLTLYRRIHGFIDSTVTGGTLRTQSNGGNPCLVGASSTAALAGIPATATVMGAYLYWSGSGATVDNQVTLDASSLTADRTWVATYILGATTYNYFGGFEDVTAYVQGKRNGNYTFSGLTVDTGNPYCSLQAVLAGWSLIVIYQDASATGKTLVLYDGFDVARNGSTAYVLSGIYASPPPQGKAIYLVWEGDETLSGATESLVFNGSSLSDGLNPVNNVYNSTINTLGSSTSYGVDLDSFDVSSTIAARDTSASTTVSVGPDLVILNAVLLQVKSNVIVGTVFEDVSYGGGAGRDLATAVTGGAGFTVPRPGATVELYDTLGNIIRTTTTDASGGYGFAGLVDGNYTVRVVNGTVTSSRPGAVGTLVPVQTYRTDASTGTAVAVTNEVGGATPAGQDGPANPGAANLGSFTAQSKAPVLVTTGIAVTAVDFGFNFDTVANKNDTGQGSLRQALTNANTLGNAGLAQSGRPAGIDNVLFMLADGTARPGLKAAYPTMFVGGVATISPASALPVITQATVLDATLQPNYVATPVIELAGNLAGGAANGLRITAGGSTVKGLVVNRFGQAGIELATAGANTVQKCFVGTNAAGSAAAANNEGIFVNGVPGNTIGGTGATDGNLVSGNLQRGIAIVGAAAAANLVQGNTVGLDVARAATIANGSAGIEVGTSAPNNTIGGTVSGAANVVSGNTGAGVRIASGSGNRISRNSTYANGGLGIDLNSDAVTLNDNGDADAGPNTLLNYPVISGAVVAGANLTVSGFARPGSILEFFLSDPDPTGFGEGKTYLFTATEGSGADLDAGTGTYGPGAVNGRPQGTDTTNRFKFVVATPGGVVAGSQLTATATDGSNDTSEFSGLVVVVAPAIVKKAFTVGGTPIPDVSAVPRGVQVRFLLYVNAQGAQITDVSIHDLLAASFAYVAGSLRYDGNSLSCAAATCTPAEEAAIFAAVNAGTAGSDAVDGDVVSFGASTVRAGNQSAANAQLDVAAGKIWGVVFTVRIQ